MRDGVRAACEINELTRVMGFYFLCTWNVIKGDRLPPRLSCISRHRRHMHADGSDRVRGAAIAPVDSNWPRDSSPPQTALGPGLILQPPKIACRDQKIFVH